MADLSRLTLAELAAALAPPDYYTPESNPLGNRRDWDGTDNYEAMAEAAARLEGIVRSRPAAGGGET